MRLIITTLVLLFVMQLAAQNSFQESVYFETDKHELTPDAKANLDQLISDIRLLEDYEITLLAHTDDQGSAIYNRRLANRRATAVAQYLQTENLQAKKTDIQSFGEENPTYSNTDEQGRSQNRRVDIIVETSSALSLDGLFEQWQTEQQQHYSIDGSTNTKLIGEQGTAVWFEAGALVFEDGTPATGKIEVTLQEAYNYSDMLMANLSTHSDDVLLETGGMIYLSATANGKTLKVKAGEELVIALPRGDFKDDMEVFTAAMDANNQVLNWQPTNDAFGKDLSSVLNIGPRPSIPVRDRSTYAIDESTKPEKVHEPKMPSEPRAPKAAQQRFYPDFWQRLLWSDEKIAAEEKSRYEKAYKDYEKRRDYYPTRVEKYEQKQAQHAQYLKQLKQWELEQERERIAFYEEKHAKFAAQHRLYAEAYKKWKAAREKRLAELESFEEFGNQGLDVTAAYFASVTNFGWINCDRFQRIPNSQKMQLAVADKDATDERVYVLLKNSNALVRTAHKDMLYLSMVIPKGVPATIVGLKFDGRQPMLAELEVNSTPNVHYELDYQPYSVKALKARLSRLNQG